MTLKGADKVLRGIRLEVQKQSLKAVDSSKRKLLVELQESTPVDTGEARDGWRVTSKGLENDVEHIIALNEGHSPQAEPNFIEHSVLKLGLKINGSIVQFK